MANHRAAGILCFFYLSVFFSLCLTVYGWGIDGHQAICTIAQSRLNDAASEAVKQLLPEYAEGDLGVVCDWADRVKFRYRWSSPLHYSDVPDSLCTIFSVFVSFFCLGDCHDDDGNAGRCVVGAINNYTTQLLTYKADPSQTEYNLTEALLFLSHLMGDVHQPLHVGHSSDKGGNTIEVHWYTRKANLHHIWDANIIETAEERFHDSNINELVDSLIHKIETTWADDEQGWENCAQNKVTCPNIYASESTKAACEWAYKDVTEGSVLEDEYFLSRLPTVYQRLAQAAVRLAATLNRIFESE